MSESVYSSFVMSLVIGKNENRDEKIRSPVYSSILAKLTRRECATLFFSVKRNPAFDAWIDLYAGEAFEQRVYEYIQLVDCACAEALKMVFSEMTKHFIIACKLEHMFWDQALTLKSWPEFEDN